MSNEDHPFAGGLRLPAAGADPTEPGDDELRVFKAIADHAFYANVITDSENNFRYVNHYFAELCGYAPEEMIGRSISLVHTPEQVAVSRGIIETSAKNGFSEPQEHWYLRRDGTEFPLLVGCVTVEIDGGACTAMSAVDVSPVHKAEAAYKTLFTEMLDGFAHHRIICNDRGEPVDYRYLAVNPAFERMTGLRATDIVGRTVMEVFPGTERSWIDTYGKVALTGEPIRFEDYSGVLDKRFEVAAFCPAPGEFACIFQDVSESKRAVEALRRSEGELQRTQRLARLGSWTWDAATDETSWSKTLFELFGFDPTSGTPTFADQAALYTPASYETLAKAVAETVEDGVPYELELEIVRSDGAPGWLWNRGEPLTDAEGRITGLWGSSQDITDRKRAERVLHQSQRELLQAQQSAHLGTWRWNFEADTVEWSDELFSIFGLDPASTPPRFPAQEPLFVPESYQALSVAAAETVKSGVPYDIEVQIVRAGGETRWIWAHGEAIVAPDGRRIGLWGSHQDVTDRRRQEVERANLEAQLARAQRLESVGRLAGGVAHDFNNMLTVILGHSERNLARLRPEDPVHADLEQIRQAAERSADLTRQLLAFARNQPASPTVIDVNETVANALNMLGRLIGEDIELVWKPGANVATARIDPSHVSQILTNLCVNARDAIADVGRIIIETNNVSFDDEYCGRHPDYLPGDYVQLAVTDNGSGMDSETLVHAFEPFFTTKELGRGTGLGLATIYGIVRQNDGFATASSTPGVGTTFNIYLPRHFAAPEPSPEASPDPPAGGAVRVDTPRTVRND
jgi:PAS domain S-box-containing protein